MNSKQRIKNRAKKRRTSEAAKKRIILLLATVLLITVGSVIFGSAFSSVQANTEEQTKCYKSIVIEAGDSLWSIANEYRGVESTKAYIGELKQLNGIVSDTIHQGQCLVVVYYK